MASIRDIINKYQGQSAPDVESQKAWSGTGAVTVNRQVEYANAQKWQAVKTEAASSAVDDQLLDQQRKQAAMQRDDQIIGLQRQGKQERERYAMSSDKIITDLENSKDKLTQAEKLDKMEAAASQLRLQDDKYRYELADVGRRKRLDDAVAFDDSLKQAVLSDEWEMFQNNIAFKKMLDMDEAAFLKHLSTINVNAALELSRQESVGKAESALYSGVGSSINTGLDMWQKGYPKSTPETPSVGDTGNRQSPGYGVYGTKNTPLATRTGDQLTYGVPYSPVPGYPNK